jgi:hypothetical protein
MKKTKRTAKRSKTAIAGIVRNEKHLERGLEKKFHSFMNEWQSHIKEEIAIHDALLRGKRSFNEHLADTRRIHEKFLKKIKKL